MVAVIFICSAAAGGALRARASGGRSRGGSPPAPPSLGGPPPRLPPPPPYGGPATEGGATGERCPAPRGGACLSAAASPAAGRPAAVPRAVGWRGVPPRPRRLCRRGRPASVLAPAVLMPPCFGSLITSMAILYDGHSTSTDVVVIRHSLRQGVMRAKAPRDASRLRRAAPRAQAPQDENYNEVNDDKISR